MVSSEGSFANHLCDVKAGKNPRRKWRSAMRIGIVGLKGHQGVVFKGAEELGGCSVVAVSDDNPRELEGFLKQHPLAKGAQTYADWRMLLEHTMMDVCVVCDENGAR